jgi:hypothetical protein
VAANPDRVALWAVIMAVVAMFAAAASAHAGSGGLGPGGASASCPGGEFGSRSLSRGDCGGDVRTLNWLLAATSVGPSTYGPHFRFSTERSVEAYQAKRGLRRSGVVGAATRGELLAGMRRDGASWYGPGFYGERTACGVRLTRRTVGVAHRGLPCGTRVTIAYRGRYLRTRVIDRGPYAKGLKWDLTNGARKLLGLKVTTTVRSAIAR